MGYVLLYDSLLLLLIYLVGESPAVADWSDTYDWSSQAPNRYDFSSSMPELDPVESLRRLNISSAPISPVVSVNSFYKL